MAKIFVIAWREFLATLLTKGFLIGLLLPPVLIGLAITLFPLLINKKPPSVSGHIAVIDPSGAVAPRIQDAYTEEKLRARREQKIREAVKAGTDALGLQGDAAKQAQAAAASQSPFPGAAKLGQPELPKLTVTVLPPDTDAAKAREAILQATGREQEGSDARLALIYVPPGVVEGVAASAGAPAETPSAAAPAPAPAPAFAEYELFVAPRLDIEVQDDIRAQANRAIIDARLARAGLDVAAVRTLTTPPKSKTLSVTKEGTRKTNEAAALLVPGAFMILLWISIFTAGQYLLAGTIEEKGNRVMEVLLSAASPMELMVGKIIGKGALGAVILLLYGGVGILGLLIFALTHLIAWQTLAMTLGYFIIAYLTIACLMAAVGAAVTDVTEAQSLLGPIMMILVIPMMLWMPIMRNPNSTFAVVCSFVPLINPFIMVLRISGSEPIPTWQIPASFIVGILTVCTIAWMAAKIFRIGVLMYGKPPDFRTLLRWIRMA